MHTCSPTIFRNDSELSGEHSGDGMLTGKSPRNPERRERVVHFFLPVSSESPRNPDEPCKYEALVSLPE